MGAMSNGQKILGAFGVLYLLIGVLGFIPGVTVPAGPPGQGLLLGIFAVNTVHNIAHLVLGAVMLWGAFSPGQVRLVARALAVVFALLVVASFIGPIVEGVAINPPDTILHLVSLVVMGYVGFRGGSRAAGEIA